MRGAAAPRGCRSTTLRGGRCAHRRRYFTKSYGTIGLIAADLLWAIGRASYLVRRAVGLGDAPKLEPVPPRFALDLLIGDARAVVRNLRGDAGMREKRA